MVILFTIPSQISHVNFVSYKISDIPCDLYKEQHSTKAVRYNDRTQINFPNATFVAIKFKDICKVRCMETSARITWIKRKIFFLEKVVFLISKRCPVSSVGRA